MSDQPHDRVLFHRLEQPVSSDWNLTQSQLDETLRNHLDYLFRQRISISNDRGVARSGFFGDAFKLRPQSPASGQIAVTAGLGFQVVAVNPGTDSNINGIAGLSDLAQYKPLVLSTDELLTIAPNVDNTKERYDLIEVKADRHFDNTQPVNIYDSAGKVYLPAAPPLAKNFGWDLTTRQGTVTTPVASTAAISVKKGLEAAVGTALIPAKTSGYIVLGVVKVDQAATTFDADVIMDRRPLLLAKGFGTISCKVSYDKTTGIPTLSDLDAPPGVLVAAIGNNGAEPAATLRLRIFAGGDYSGLNAVAVCEGGSGTRILVAQINSTGIDFSLATNALVGGLDLAYQGALQQPWSSPNLKMAIGQPYAQVLIKATSQDAAVTGTGNLPNNVVYRIYATLNGAGPY